MAGRVSPRTTPDILDRNVNEALIKYDWLWSSAADYAGVRKGPAPLHLDSLPPIGEIA
jgi:hypothetical protein